MITVAGWAAEDRMVLIPSGEFMMGRPKPEKSDTRSIQQVWYLTQQKPIHNYPQHPVRLNAYYLDRVEVSNAHYRKFVEQHPEWSIPEARTISGKADANYLVHWDDPRSRLSPAEDFPVIYVSWFAANAFCKSQGKRLPTEAEWEYAATKAFALQKFPLKPEALESLSWFYYNAELSTHPVNSKSADSLGMFHLLGNVWEWTADWFSKDYYEASPENNPTGPESGEAKVIRGGGWNDSPARLTPNIREFVRPHHAVEDLGFRCAKSVF
ncbi:MAG: formylglycine-generating enzyme family protein [SAR324 cluster bacterium]|nr:formylglycine-generating enzyme family protein [SAR324 cluster bacterium]